MENYYEILEISTTADQDQILKAYLRAKQSFSPDSLASYSIFDEEEGRQLLDKIEQAYLVLSNEEKRREYDRVHNINGNNDTQSHVKIESVSSDPTPEGFAPRSLEEARRIAPEVAASGGQIRTASNSNSGNSFTPSFTSPLKDVFFVTRKQLEKHAPARNDDIETWLTTHQEWTGPDLKKVREYRGVSIGDLADFTKIRKTHIGNIETENFSELPVKVYIRGFLQQIAKALDLEPNAVINSYLARMPEKLKETYR